MSGAHSGESTTTVRSANYQLLAQLAQLAVVGNYRSSPTSSYDQSTTASYEQWRQTR